MIYVLGGGTFNHVRAHLSLAAPAFGETARSIHRMVYKHCDRLGIRVPHLVLTKMAHSSSSLVTNADVSNWLKRLLTEDKNKLIFMNVALCDYEGEIVPAPGALPIPSGKYAARLKTRDGEQVLRMTPTDKLVSSIRATRPDMFVVAFKTTSEASPDEQHAAGLNLLRSADVSLVLANDLVTRNNMVITPDGGRHHETTDRAAALTGLVEMAMRLSGLDPAGGLAPSPRAEQ